MYVSEVENQNLPDTPLFTGLTRKLLEGYFKLYGTQHFKVFTLHHSDRTCIGYFYFYTYTRLGFRFTITPPGLPNIGLVFINGAQKNQTRIGQEKDMLQLLADNLWLKKSHYVELVLPETFQEMQTLIWSGYLVEPRYTYHLNLNGTQESILTAMSSELRRSIQNFDAAPFEIKRNEASSNIKPLINRYYRNKKIALSSNISLKLMELYQSQNQALSFTVYKNKVPVAFTFFKVHPDRLQYLFGAHEPHLPSGLNSWLFWLAILEAKNLQLQLLDFEGSMIPEVERFYRKFGGDLKVLYSIKRNTFLIKWYFWLKAKIT